jgi:hypothetical protein
MNYASQVSQNVRVTDDLNNGVANRDTARCLSSGRADRGPNTPRITELTAPPTVSQTLSVPFGGVDESGFGHP